MTEESPRVPRRTATRKRRNYEREFRDVLAYCKAHVEVLQELNGDDRYVQGKSVAFSQVIAKLEGFAK